MSPANWTQLVVVLAAASLATGLLSWRPTGRVVFVPFTVVLLGASAVVAAVAPVVAHGRVALTVLVAVTGALAVAGGGPLTAGEVLISGGGWQRRPGACPGGADEGAVPEARRPRRSRSGACWGGADTAPCH